jgi:hypothetical protein
MKNDREILVRMDSISDEYGMCTHVVLTELDGSVIKDEMSGDHTEVLPNAWAKNPSTQPASNWGV